MNKLTKKIKSVWLLRNLLISLIPLGVLCGGVALIFENIIAGIIMIFIPLCLLFVLIMYPTWAYNRYSYNYSERKIEIIRGVIFKHHIVVPVRQIQDLHLYEGPIMMLFKLKGVIISTAGSNYLIAGLDSNTAEGMIKELEQYLNDRLDEE